MDRAVLFPPTLPNVVVLAGPSAILPLAPVLERFASACGQPAAMNWLAYFLAAEAAHRLPHLVLELAAGLDRNHLPLATLTPADLRSATLMAEYRILALRTRAFVPADAGGLRSVVAPAADRSRAAHLAAEALLACGAELALISYDATACAPLPFCSSLPGLEAAGRSRAIHARLPLAATLDDTLAGLSRATRYNLRYYRRRLERECDLEFVPDACTALTPEAVLAINRSSHFPQPQDEFQRRLDACRLPGGYLIGLRIKNGPWLSLAGGWRQHHTSVLHFQTNASGWERASLSVVMRSFLFENEIAHGCRELFFYGGTPHPLRRAFIEQPVHDLVVRRQGVGWRVLSALAQLDRAGRRTRGRANFLAETLLGGELDWQPVSAALPHTPELDTSEFHPARRPAANAPDLPETPALTPSRHAA